MYGSDGYLAISKQNSFGTFLNSWQWVPFISEGIADTVEFLREEAIQQRYEAGKSYAGLMTAEGDITLEAHPRILGTFLRGALGVSSTTATVSGYVYTNIFTPTQALTHDSRCPLPPYSIDICRGSGQEDFLFSDCLVNNLSLDIESQKLTRLTAGLLCRVSSIYDDPGIASYYATDPWAWSTCSVSIGGAAFDQIETLSIKIENGLEGLATLDTTRYWNRFVRGSHRKFTISGRMDYEDASAVRTLKAGVRAGSAYALVITLTGGTAISSGYYNTLKIEVPQAKLTRFESMIGGPGRLEADFEFDGEYHVGSGMALKATLVNAHIGGY